MILVFIHASDSGAWKWAKASSVSGQVEQIVKRCLIELPLISWFYPAFKIRSGKPTSPANGFTAIPQPKE
jgi:hypothetical protein